MISNSYIFSLHHQEIPKNGSKKGPSHAGKGIATTEISDAGSALAGAQRQQTLPAITMEEFRMMREEMRELRTKN